MVCTNIKTQSPIDIITNKTTKCIQNCDLTFFYSNSNCNILRTVQDILLEYEQGSYVIYNNNTYYLEKIAFTNPSNHQIDGSTFQIEADLYHIEPTTGKILIICILIRVNHSISKSKTFLDSFIHSIPTNIDQSITLNLNNWNIFNLLPEIKSFFSYNGSVIRNPCTQSAIWIIMNQPVNCSQAFHTTLSQLIHKNARPIQPLYSRVIYSNPNLDIHAQLNYATINKSKSPIHTSTHTDTKSCVSLQQKICHLTIYKNIVISVFIIIIVSGILYILWLNEKGDMKPIIQKMTRIIQDKILPD